MKEFNSRQISIKRVAFWFVAIPVSWALAFLIGKATLNLAKHIRDVHLQRITERKEQIELRFAERDCQNRLSGRECYRLRMLRRDI